jgi:hypothetical protein
MASDQCCRTPQPAVVGQFEQGGPLARRKLPIELSFPVCSPLVILVNNLRPDSRTPRDSELAEQIQNGRMDMMRLKVEKIEEGLHPSELVVSVQTKTGPVSLVVDARAVSPGDTIGVGWPLGKDKDYYLVELPRETLAGNSRVWVQEKELEGSEEKKGRLVDSH